MLWNRRRYIVLPIGTNLLHVPHMLCRDLLFAVCKKFVYRKGSSQGWLVLRYNIIVSDYICDLFGQVMLLRPQRS